MNKVELSRALGWLSVALGVTELVAAKRLAEAVGHPAAEPIIRGFGAREVSTGVLILSNPVEPVGLWARVAGDALDLAVLAQGLRQAEDRADEGEDGTPARTGAAVALAAVAGVTILDLLCAGMLQRRDARILETARRTHVRPLEAGRA